VFSCVFHLKEKQNSSRKSKKPPVLKITRLNVLDPVPVLGWIYCAYHQSTPCPKPCLNVEGFMNGHGKNGEPGGWGPGSFSKHA